MPAFDIRPYIQQTPAQVRQKIRAGQIDFPTAGMTAGYAQANLVILPQIYAHDFREWIRQNPQACPLLETIELAPLTKTIAQHANICTDIPRYRIYENGRFTKEATDVSEYWQSDMVGFLIGCSFSFEEALLKAGIEIRHLTEKHNVPMYKTSVMTNPVGRFKGPMVVSMRPMSPAKAQLARQITAQMPNVHGAPIQIGDPAAIGISDLDHPDYGDADTIKPGEVPVFWPCGVTPQAAIENAKLPLVISHAPGHMFITDIQNAELNDYLDAHQPE